jgi:TonB family protein
MAMFEMLAESPATRAVGLALLHFIWQGAVIAAAAGWLFHLLRRAPASSRYSVGCVALLVMTALPPLTTLRAIDAPGQRDKASTGAVHLTIDADQHPPVLVGAPMLVQPVEAGVPAGTPRVLSAVVMAWGLGVALLTINLAGAWIRTRLLCRQARVVGEPWAGRARSAAMNLGVIRGVRLTESPSVDVPTVVGWMRPVIIVPASVFTGLTPSQLDAILMHELAHVRRHDYLINVIQSVVETVLFYHPAVWWLSRRVRFEREICCDDLVLQTGSDRVVYARALAALEAMRLDRPVLGVAATDGNLLARVRRILAPIEIDQSRSSAWGVVAAVIAVAPIVLVGSGAGIPKSSGPPMAAARGDIALLAPDRGQEVTLPVAARAERQQPAQPSAARGNDEAAILALEEQFRLAKIERDVPALDRLLDDAVISTNQSGSRRNKTQLLELWRTFPVDLLSLDSADVQITGDLATVTGRQSEVSGTGNDTMLFTRIWRRTGGTWRLFSVTQFRDPGQNTDESLRVTAAGPVEFFRLQYELFRDGALIGRPGLTLVTGRPGTVQIPGDAPVAVTATRGAAGTIQLTLQGRALPASATTLVLTGTAPQEATWSSGTRTYRLQFRLATTTASAQPVPAVGSLVRRPQMLKRVDPLYPQVAKDAKVAGMVIVEIIVDEEGNVADAKIVRSVPMLDAAALDAVRQWKYTPSRDAQGQPIKVVMSVNVTFALPG